MSDISQQSIKQTEGKIEEIKEEIRKTPYHKGTEHYIGRLRAKISRLKDKEIESSIKKSGGGGGGYAVKKHGDATVVLIGPPSVGKSTLINKLTNTKSKVAEYAFTTLGVIPGMLFYKDAYIQIFDVPGIIAGAKSGKGRGKEVISVARNADLLIIMCDVNTPLLFGQITEDLYGAGMRINTNKPAIHIDKKTSGGIIIHSNIKQELKPETISEIISEMGIKNAEISLKEKYSIDSLIDAFSTNRAYIPAILVVNKIDTNRELNTNNNGDIIYISADKGIGLNELKEKIWEKLDFIRVYLVKPSEEPSFENPIVAKSGQTLKDIAKNISEEFLESKSAAKIWGASARFPGQEVSLSTPALEGMQVRFV